MESKIKFSTGKTILHIFILFILLMAGNILSDMF